MMIGNDALEIVQKTSENLELRLNTSELGYTLESDDEVIDSVNLIHRYL